MIPGGKDLEVVISEGGQVRDLVHSIQMEHPQVGELLDKKKGIDIGESRNCTLGHGA